MSKYVSRKFILVLLFGCVGSLGFLMGKDIGPYTTFIGVLFGIYTGGDVGINFVHKDKVNPDDPKSGKLP